MDRKSKFHFAHIRPERVMFTRMFSTSIVKCLSILITSLSKVTWHDKDAPAVKLALFFFCGCVSMGRVLWLKSVCSVSQWVCK